MTTERHKEHKEVSCGQPVDLGYLMRETDSNKGERAVEENFPTHRFRFSSFDNYLCLQLRQKSEIILGHSQYRER